MRGKKKKAAVIRSSWIFVKAVHVILWKSCFYIIVYGAWPAGCRLSMLGEEAEHSVCFPDLRLMGSFQSLWAVSKPQCFWSHYRYMYAAASTEIVKL